ncbi:hypothetical protein [Halorubrum sp. CBA1229]|uniref:hypothetical protein n=1 Tax=Halorubrum sp. CBA1229 TaxID=1853699 RepID=UPI000F40ECA4|nr:hypothetical protein [Halorubrum sp. CBA1229]QKY15336.1 hypothetical protein Hrr1229_001525 [Halorubrum sp. CBA1229]
MRGPAAKLFYPVVSPLFLNAIHEELSDGLGDAESAPLDIQWSELGMYSPFKNRIEKVNRPLL